MTSTYQGPHQTKNWIGQDFDLCHIVDHLRPKNQYSGPAYCWCGLGKLLWGKFQVLLAGERLVSGIPLSHFTADFEKGATLGDVTDKATSMSRYEIEKSGGFWIYLTAGQGVLIPPCYLLLEVNHGALVGEGAQESDASVDALVS